MRIKRVKLENSSSSAFEQMYVTNYHKIKSFCNHYLRDDNLSKNAAQDVFVSVWNNRYNLGFSDALETDTITKCRSRADESLSV